MDDDADGPAPPLKMARKTKTGFVDRALACLGLALAGASAVLPWYVFFNEEKFGIHVARGGDRSRDLPDWPARNAFTVSPLAMLNRNDKQLMAVVPDLMTTATVTDRGREDLTGEAAVNQPFPGKSPFRLLHVANGRALIEDAGGMYLVRLGSILPDNSRLAAMEQRDGKWVIVTSSGDVYQNE
jgi:hypothetical protein